MSVPNAVVSEPIGASQDSPDPPPADWRGRLAPWLKRMGARVVKSAGVVRGFARRRFDGLFRAAALRRSLFRERDDHQKRDRRSYENAALPTGEELRVGCLWVFEAFLSSHTDALHRRMAALGLDRRFGFEESAIEALERSRTQMHLGGRRPLGYLVPKSRQGFTLGRKTDLPRGVESVFMELHMLSSSTSILSAQFRFDEQTARSIETPLQTYYETTLRRTPSGFAIPSGSHLREDVVKELRAALRRRCVRWMNETVPGAFAELQLGESPTVELITMLTGDPRLGKPKPTTTRHAADATDNSAGVVANTPEWELPFPKAHGTEEMTYLTYLSVDHGDAWEGVDFPGYTLRLPSWHDAYHDHISLSVRVSDIVLHMERDAKTPEAAVSHAYWLSTTLSHFALNRLMRAYEAHLARLRDELARVRLRGSASAIRQLARIGRSTFAITRDIRPFCHELEESKQETLTGWDVYTFAPLDERRYERPLPSLIHAWAKDCLATRKRLLLAELEVRSTLESMSNLAAAEVNIAAARSNNRLQLAVAILAVVAVLFAYLALPDAARESIARIVRW